MKKLFKFLGIILIVIVVLIGAGIAYLFITFPKVSSAPEMKIETTPQRLERGKYLAWGPAGCIGCHSRYDYTKFSYPVTPGTEGMGGEDIGAFEGGGFVPARNITPDKETGIGRWTDGEIFRAIASGVDKNGKSIAPMMPYMGYARMDKEDVLSIIAYIKTLKPVKNQIPERNLSFPLSLIVRIIPAEPTFSKLPDTKDKIKTGEYYAGACFSCHTPFEKGKPNMEMLFAGGREFPLPDGSIIRSSNLTPDKETGIGNLSKEQFIEKFRFYKNAANLNPQERGFTTVMPWYDIANFFKEEDLSAIYDFLQTLPVKKNVVVKIGQQDVK